MKAFLDTSVLVATFDADHEHHAASIDLFLSLGKDTGSCGVHSLAEVYAVLTGMPGVRRASGTEALLFLTEIRERLAVVTLDEGEYFEMIEDCGAAGLMGAASYDAVLGYCALKADAEVLYTWNATDFLRLPRPIPERVRSPETQ